MRAKRDSCAHSTFNCDGRSFLTELPKAERSSTVMVVASTGKLIVAKEPQYSPGATSRSVDRSCAISTEANERGVPDTQILRAAGPSHVSVADLIASSVPSGELEGVF